MNYKRLSVRFKKNVAKALLFTAGLIAYAAVWLLLVAMGEALLGSFGLAFVVIAFFPITFAVIDALVSEDTESRFERYEREFRQLVDEAKELARGQLDA